MALVFKLKVQALGVFIFHFTFNVISNLIILHNSLICYTLRGSDVNRKIGFFVETN